MTTEHRKVEHTYFQGFVPCLCLVAGSEGFNAPEKEFDQVLMQRQSEVE